MSLINSWIRQISNNHSRIDLYSLAKYHKIKLITASTADVALLAPVDVIINGCSSVHMYWQTFNSTCEPSIQSRWGSVLYRIVIYLLVL